MTAPDLTRLLDEVWGAFEDAARRAKHPLHVPTVATVREGRPTLRSVVLQRVDRDAGTLGFNTDARGAKIADLTANPAIALHFYDPAAKVQIRAGAEATIHVDDALAEAAWTAVTPLGRRCYGQQPDPGSDESATGIALPDVVLPDFDLLKDGDTDTLSAIRKNFCAVQCRVISIDHLYLRYEGHRRARFDRTADGWSTGWIAP